MTHQVFNIVIDDEVQFLSVKTQCLAKTGSILLIIITFLYTAVLCRLGRHQTQAINPKRDEEVLLKQHELKKMDAGEAEIKLGEEIIFAQDEGH